MGRRLLMFRPRIKSGDEAPKVGAGNTVAIAGWAWIPAFAGMTQVSRIRRRIPPAFRPKYNAHLQLWRASYPSPASGKTVP